MYAHAKIDKVDTAAAKAAPGVVGVFTGDDVAADGLGGLPCGWLIKNKDGSNMVEPAHPALAQGKVRHVGDPVAMVIATSKAAAKAAAGLVDIELRGAAGGRPARRRVQARRAAWSTTRPRATCATTGTSAIWRRPTRRSPRPPTSSSST